MTAADHPRLALVVPCYNEAARLAVAEFESFAASHPDVRFVMVDDGSSDTTLACLEGLRARSPRGFDVVALPSNAGKAEAVRAGMLHAFDLGAELCGFWDADLATPLDELDQFVATLDDRRSLLMVFGARVQLLGRSIARSALRHYLGRLFATVASLALRLAVYDTQCGAKVFRATPITHALFATPFEAGWIFDVELIARLIRLRRQLDRNDVAQLIYELPLRTWHDVPGSKVRARDFARAMLQMMRIYHRYLRRGAPPLPLETGVQADRVPM